MTAQLPPASGYQDGSAHPRTGGYRTLSTGDGSGTRAQPGESSPARMLSGVLLLVVATIIVGLALVWWLA